VFKAGSPTPAAAIDQDPPAADEPRAAEAGRGASVLRAIGVGSGLLARLVRLVLSGVVLIIAAGILLALLRANVTNTIVSEVHGWGRWLASPFNDMFSFSTVRVAVAVNWGIAAAVYLFAGGLIVRLINRPHRWHPLDGRSPIRNQEGA